MVLVLHIGEHKTFIHMHEALVWSLSSGGCPGGQTVASLVFLEEELAGEENKQDMEGSCNRAAEHSNGEAAGCG